MKPLYRAQWVLRQQPPRHLTRQFSSTTTSLLRTRELQESNFGSLRADASRIWSDIHSTAKFGKGKAYGELPEQSGLARLALSQPDKEARDWFVQTTKDLGCDVQIDKIGNIFAVRKGLNNDVPPTFVGSHLDSQPNGGRFDGVLGVCAGVEMLRVLNDNWIETEGPVGVVNWTNEEGARWTKSMMGSGVWAGANKLEGVWKLKDRQGVSVKRALEEIRYLGEVGVGEDRVKMAGHFELHIEQGKVLEKNNEVIGVVEGVQAYRWFTVTVEGKEGHAGATAWEDRCDALKAANKMLRGCYKYAENSGGLVTVGTIRVENGSVNTIPGKVVMSLDVRHQDEQELKRLIKAISSHVIPAITANNGSKGQVFASNPKIMMKEDFASEAVKFNETAMGWVKTSAKSVLGSKEEVRSMISGAGHDSVNTNLHCPTAMIFVPCKDGITHAPEEWCTEQNAKIGTDVLIESVLRFDRSHHGGHAKGVVSLDREL